MGGQRHGMGRAAVWLCAAVLAVGCQDDAAADGAPDQSQQSGGDFEAGPRDDGRVADGRVADGRVADGGEADGSTLDGALTDGALADGALPADAGSGDASLDDGTPDDGTPGDATRDDGTPDDGALDATQADAVVDASSDAAPAADLGADAAVDAGSDLGADAGGGVEVAVIRGRFESAGPVRNCGQVISWTAPDGLLLRPELRTCGDDMAALADTIVANLDAAAARGGRAMLVIGQGLNLPESWLAECTTFALDASPFVGTSCVPWDVRYQARLRAALVDVIGPAVNGHPALAGVYFTTTTMTNGSEMHFRTERSTLAPYPGDAVLRQAYLDVMDIYQTAFEVPVVFEAGHCIWRDLPGGAVEEEDCETPLALYRHARDTYGRDKVGLALWNCAERFYAYPGSVGDTTRPLLEEATADGVSLGCQTVGSFSQSCRFTDARVADYGEVPPGPGAACPVSATADPVGACVDTMNWFAGVSRRSPDSMVIRGTWSEVWSPDYAAAGIYQTSDACQAAVDQLAPTP